MKTILISGLSGSLAGLFAKEFSDKYKFIDIGRAVKGRDEPTVAWDFSKKLGVIGIKEEIDYVLHFGSMTDISRCESLKYDALLTNSVGTQQLLDFAKNRGVKKFIYVSTGSVYESADFGHVESSQKVPSDFYSLTKLLSEKLCQYYSKFLPTIVVRPFFPYGPGTKPNRLISALIDRVLNNEEILLNHGDKPLINPIFISDFNAALVALLEKENGQYSEYNLGGKDVLSIREISTLIGEYLGKQLFFKSTNKKTNNWVGDSAKIAGIYKQKFNFKEGLELTIDDKTRN